MRHPLMLLVALLACSGARATVQLDIPPTHPRIWFGDAGRLQQAQDYFATAPFTVGNFNPVDAAGTNYRRALLHVVADVPQACAHALRGDPATPPANRALDTGLLGVTFSSGPSTFRDQMRQQGDSWLLVYDWCHAAMTLPERNQLIDRWNGHMQRELDDTFAQDGEEASNYWSGRVRNLLLWGIASHGENPRAQEFIDAALEIRMRDGFGDWYQDFGVGGVFPEGSDYGVVSLSYPLMAFTTAADFGFDPYQQTPYFREALYALIYGSTPGPSSITAQASNLFGLFPFGDDQNFLAGGAINRRTYLGDYTSVMGLRDTGSGNARHARAWRAMTDAGTSWLFRAVAAPAQPPSALTDLPLDYYASGAGVFAMRTAHAPDAMQVHLQLGTPGGMSHRHMDAGSVQVWRKGQWLTRESTGYSDKLGALGEPSGSLVTVETDDAVAHNTLLFEGATTGTWIGDGPQVVPPGGNPDSDQPRELPQVKRLQHAEQFAYVAVDYSAAYRNGRDTRVDWPYTETAWREFLFIRPLQALVMLDRTRASSDALRPFYATDSWLWRDIGRRVGADAVQRTFIMHFETEPDLHGASRLTAAVGNQTSELTMLLPANPAVRVINEDVILRNGDGDITLDDSHAGQHRLEVSQQGSPDAYFMNVLTGYDVGEAPIDMQLSEDATRWTLTLAHPVRGSAVVVFEKGVQSHGGSIRIGNESATPLAAQVQRITVTRDGPVWESLCILCDGFESSP